MKISDFAGQRGRVDGEEGLIGEHLFLLLLVGHLLSHELDFLRGEGLHLGLQLGKLLLLDLNHLLLHRKLLILSDNLVLTGLQLAL